MELALAIVGAVGTALGIVWWWLKRKPPKKQVEKDYVEITKRRAKVSKMRWLLQKRKLTDLEMELERQDRELAALRLRGEADQADGTKDP